MGAVIDIGSNSVLLLIARRREDGSLDIARDEARITRLSEGVAARGSLSPAAIDRTIAALEAYRVEVDAVGARASLEVVATEGLRMADNAHAFLERAEALLERPVRIISGDEEARLSYRSVALECPGDVPLRVVDIGGASTELVVGRGAEVEQAVSHRLGSVRISELLSDGHPPSADALARMYSHAREVLAAQPLAPLAELHGVAGTVTTLAAYKHGLERYDRDVVDHTRVSLDELRALREHLASLDLDALRAIPMIGAGRADVIVGGATILLAVVEHCGADTLVARDRGLRYALL